MLFYCICLTMFKNFYFRMLDDKELDLIFYFDTKLYVKICFKFFFYFFTVRTFPMFFKNLTNLLFLQEVVGRYNNECIFSENIVSKIVEVVFETVVLYVCFEHAVNTSCHFTLCLVRITLS